MASSHARTRVRAREGTRAITRARCRRQSPSRHKRLLVSGRWMTLVGYVVAHDFALAKVNRREIFDEWQCAAAR